MPTVVARTGEQFDPLTAPDFSVLQRILLESTDSVTHFLETLTGEPLDADVVRQYRTAALADNDLGVTAGHGVTHRNAVLKGRTSNLPYVCAESVFVPERLPEQACIQLERTNNPIGRVLVSVGVSLCRQPFPQPDRLRTHVPDSFAEFASEIAWSRAYRLMVDEMPVFAIREWFLRSVRDAIDR